MVVEDRFVADERQGALWLDGLDRRTARRVQLLKLAWFCTVDTEAANKAEGLAQSCDVSLSGVGMRVAQTVRVGTRVFIEIVSRDLCLSALGVVMRSIAVENGQTLLGIQFEVVPPNDRMSLTRYCNERPGQ
jgi:c-di-GMP-binding flagellar brake protein YcgR